MKAGKVQETGTSEKRRTAGYYWKLHSTLEFPYFRQPYFQITVHYYMYIITFYTYTIHIIMYNKQKLTASTWFGLVWG